MKTNKKYLFFGLLGLLIVLFIGGYLYLNPSHRNIAEEKASFTVTASELQENFRTSSETKMADQVVNIQGKITALDEKSATLDNKVEVSFTEKLPPSFEIGMEITVKGRCVGYDELLEMVKVDQAVVVEAP